MKQLEAVDAVAGEVAQSLRKSGKAGAGALPAVAMIASAVIAYTVAAGGELDEAAQGLVKGAIAAAADLGLDPASARLAAAQATLDAAFPYGAAASELVRFGLVKLIGRGPL